MDSKKKKWEVEGKGNSSILKAKRKDLHRPILMVCHELKYMISSILATYGLKINLPHVLSKFQDLRIKVKVPKTTAFKKMKEKVEEVTSQQNINI